MLSDFKDAKVCSPGMFESLRILSFFVIGTTGGETFVLENTKPLIGPQPLLIVILLNIVFLSLF
jgi:hypothetical protein